MELVHPGNRQIRFLRPDAVSFTDAAEKRRVLEMQQSEDELVQMIAEEQMHNTKNTLLWLL